MKTHIRLLTVVAALAGCHSASAQYYELANQIANVIQPALSGSFRYKGFAEASYIKNLGNFNADYVELSTSQGFQYASWFYMGAGLGFDLVFSHPNNDWGNGWQTPNYPGPSRKSVTTTVMMPIFTDFRFNFGNPEATDLYIDLRIGASFPLTDNWIRINNGYLNDSQYFYLRPGVGVRIPTNKANGRQALNVGISYQLLATSYWNSYESNSALNGLGVNVAYEW